MVRFKLLGTVEVECCDDKETVQRVVKELKVSDNLTEQLVRLCLVRKKEHLSYKK